VKKVIIIIAIFCFSEFSLAESGGVESRNFSISTSASNSDIGNRVSVSGGVRFPLVYYTGVSITGRYSNFFGKNNYIDSSNYSGSFGVFLRKYNLGILNARYGYSRTKSDFEGRNSKNSIKSVSINGTYYFKELDISVGLSRSEPDTGDSLNTSSAGVSYYVNENFRAGISVVKMDADATNVFISYQPTLFRNTSSLSFSYQRSSSNNAFSFSIAYYLDTKVTIKDRVRRY